MASCQNDDGDFGLLTLQDQHEAMAYAADQIYRLKCADEELGKDICGKSGCFKWKKHNGGIRNWKMPSLISDQQCSVVKEQSQECIQKIQKGTINFGAIDCQNFDASDADRLQMTEENFKQMLKFGYGKYCAYSPKDAQSGKCHIIDKDFCETTSNFQLTCDDDKKKKDDDDCDNKPPYLEWNEYAGQCDTNAPCDSTKDCDDGSFCINGLCKTPTGGTCLPHQACVKGKCSCDTDDDCEGTSLCDNGLCSKGSRCIMGNTPLKKWCEDPSSRCKANGDGSFPDQCKSGADTPGVSDVPPFFYNSESGQCHMSYEYCNRFGTDFSGKQCTLDSDCKSGEKCFQNHCTGPESECNESKGAKIAEFFIGDTLFRQFKSGVQCDSGGGTSAKQARHLNFVNNAINDFKSQNIPTSFEHLVDEQSVKNKLLITRSFVENIDLNMCVWNDDADVTHKISLCLDPKQLEQEYPHLIRHKNGLKYLSMSVNDIGEDKRAKRIYLMYATNNNLMHNIANVQQMFQR